MKKIASAKAFGASSTLVATLILTCLGAPRASATVYTWNWTNGVSADIFWSDSLNWSPAGVPGAADSLIFNSTNSGGLCVAPGAGLNAPGAGQSQINLANFNGLVDANFGGSICAMLCSNLGGSYQNILINNNSTLTITNGLVVGNGVAAATGGVTPGSGGIDYGVTSVNVTIAGTNATLLMNNTNESLWVAEGSATSSASLIATLDLSALDNFNATLSRLLLGIPAVNRPGSYLYLAQTNNITATYQTMGVLTSDTVGTGAIVLGEGSSNGGSAPDDLYLGLVNTISADTIAIGRQKQAHSLLAFNPNLTGPQVPTATIEGYSGSQVQTWDIGDGVANSGTDTCNGTADFTLGIVNAAVSNMYVGKGPSAGTGANACTGTLNFAAGTMDVNSLWIGYGNVNSAPFGSGTVNVETNGTLGMNATLIVNSNLTLGYTVYPSAAGGASTTGILNIAGGTVWANNILAGTNSKSSLNQTAGTLIISNAAGNSTAPIQTVSLTGTLQLSVGGGVPEIVAGTLNFNGPITVNIAALPPILSYPQTYPLMQYISAFNGTAGQVALGTLPQAATPYQGYIAAGNSTIELVLTGGPVITGQDVWTGAANSNWNTTSINWSNSGVGAAFATGTPVVFDDTAHGATNVDLTAILAPAGTTVSNSALDYIFSGPGALGGSGALIKDGTGTLLITNTGNNTFSGGMVINGGSAQFGNGGADGNLPANDAAIVDDGTLILDQSPNVAVYAPISGSGSVVQDGLDAIDLEASNSYSGLTLVNAGTLLLDGWLNGGLLTNAPGTTVGGNGTNLGPFTVAGTINPGDVNAVGTLTAGDGLTLAPGGLAFFDLNGGNNTPGSGVNDFLQINGSLNANNNTVWANFQGNPSPGNSWQVMSYTGSLVGALNPALAGTHFTGVVDTSLTGVVLVTITGGTGANLKWDSTSSGVWDNSTSNWFNFATSAQDYFASGDNVQFDDSVANAQTNVTLAAGVAVYPNAVTNISSVNNYNISGAGSIAGTGSLVKDGSSLLTISTANSFTGGTTVLNGTLRAGSATAFGPNAATTTVTVNPGATLDVGGQDLGKMALTVSGAGVGNKGAIINSGAQQVNALLTVTLLGDTTFGGTNRWDIRGSGATLQANGSPVNIFKVSTNQASLVACTASDPNLENLYIEQGAFAIQTTTTQFGDPNGTITVSSNAQLNVWGLTAGLYKNIVLLDGGQIWSENNETTISGMIYLTNNNANTAPGVGIITNDANATGYSLVLASTIAGPGNLFKTGAGTTELASVNAYTGGTTVAAGTLLLAGGASIGTTTNVNVSAGATFDVSQVSPWTLSAGQTLLGGGLVNGSVVAPAQTTVAPGTSTTTGTLTINSGVTLAGVTLMKINGATGASDTLASPGSGSIVLGGALIITNMTNVAPKIGQTFALFSTPSLSGSFTSIVPATPGEGLAWNTGNLYVNGTLTVVAGPQTLRIGSNHSGGISSAGGGVFSISGSGGTPYDAYYVLSSTNLALPFADWTPVATNYFDANGDYIFSVTNTGAMQNAFYSIAQP